MEIEIIELLPGRKIHTIHNPIHVVKVFEDLGVIYYVLKEWQSTRQRWIYEVQSQHSISCSFHFGLYSLKKIVK